MERTQIYLSKSQASALDREARKRGTTRSHLIREAIEARYGPDDETEFERIKQILDNAKGMWADRTESGAEYVDRLRSADRLQEMIKRFDDEPAGHDGPD